MAEYKYFTLQELIRSEVAAKRKIDNTPSFEVVEHLAELVRTVLDPLRIAYGKSIKVSSGYRCPALNKAVGGSATSVHQIGYAVDLQVNGSFEEFRDFVVEWFRKTGTHFDQILLERNKATGAKWIHIGLYNNAGQQRGQIKVMDGSMSAQSEFRRRKPDPWERAIIPMAIIIVAILLAVTSCSPKFTPTRPVFTQLQDSSWTKQAISVKVTIDTASIRLPQQHSERDTSCDSSYLENDFAESHAWINQDGTLHHDLSTKDTDVKVPVTKVEKETDTEHSTIKEVPVPYPDPYPVEVKVPAELTPWQNFRMVLGTIVFFATLLILAAWAVKKFVLKL